MRHPYEKFIKINLFSLFLAVIIGGLAFMNGYIMLILISLYFLFISMVFEAIILHVTFRKKDSILMLFRAVLLFIFTSYLFVQLQIF